MKFTDKNTDTVHLFKM